MSKPFVQRGLDALRRQDPHAALPWFQRAVDDDDDDAEARAWLGQALCHVGRRAEGVPQLAAAATRMLQPPAGPRPDFTPRPALPPVQPMIFEALSQLQSWGGFEQAQPIARALAERLPNDARAQQLLAVICGQVNLTPEALAAVSRAQALNPQDPMIEVLRASLEADSKQHAAARGRLEPLLDRLGDALAQPGPETVGQLRALFRGLKELARVLDAMGEYDAVFAQLDAAADIAPLLPEYARLSRHQLPDAVALNSAGFAGAALPGRFAGQALPGRAPVFVLGFYRSGTTLAQEVLRAHPQVFLSDEVGLLHAVQQELQRMQPGPDPLPAKLARLDAGGIARLRAAYWSAARGHHGATCEQGLFVDKFTLNTVDLGLIDTVFPDARVLFAMRDPRDVCLSCVQQLMVPGPATMHLLRLADTVALYAQVMDFWLQVREHLALQWRLLRYEDAVSDFEATFRPLFEFIGLDWRPEVIDFHRQAAGRYVASPSRNQVAQPLYRSSVARWRRYEKEMAPVQAALAPYVEHFGYTAT